MEAAYAAREAMSRIRNDERFGVAQRQQRLARRQSERAAMTDSDRLERLGRDSHVLRRSFANHEDAFRQMDAERRRTGAEAAAAARAEARIEARARLVGAGGGAAAAGGPDAAARAACSRRGRGSTLSGRRGTTWRRRSRRTATRATAAAPAAGSASGGSRTARRRRRAWRPPTGRRARCR